MRRMDNAECGKEDPRSENLQPEVLKKLELSREKAKSLATRKMRCPVCGFLVQIIPVTQTDIVFVKCRKCKFSGPLDPALFRTQRRRASYCKKPEKGPLRGKR